MKKILLSLIFCYCAPAMAQEIGVLDLSDRTEMNYYFARVLDSTPNSKWIYKNALKVKIFEISDSKATPENLFEGCEQLSSYLVSVVPDGDYYSWSKLYKIEGFIIPKILEIKETKYPHFTVTIEYGAYAQREEKVFTLKGKD